MMIVSTIILSLTICIDSFLLCILNKTKHKTSYFLIPLIFTFFQVTFLLSGYLLGDILENHLHSHLKYIIFIIFSSMAMKLIVDTLSNKGKEKTCHFAIKDIFLQALITSFDSLFLGIPLAFNTNTYFILITIVGIVTYIACFLGLLLRNKIEDDCEEKLNIIGSIILFIFAFKSLI